MARQRQRRKAVLMTEEEAATLRRIVDKVRKLGPASPPINPEWFDKPPSAPDTHIILVPEDGIPALTYLGSGSGTGSGTQSPPPAESIPGVAECQVYEPRVDPVTGSRELKGIEGYFIEVLNLETRKIPTGFSTATRERWGEWIHNPGGAEGIIEAVVTQTGGIAAGGHGEVTFWDNLAATERTDEVYYDWIFNENLPVGQRITMYWKANRLDGEGCYVVLTPWCA